MIIFVLLNTLRRPRIWVLKNFFIIRAPSYEGCVLGRTIFEVVAYLTRRRLELSRVKKAQVIYQALVTYSNERILGVEKYLKMTQDELESLPITKTSMEAYCKCFLKTCYMQAYMFVIRRK